MVNDEVNTFIMDPLEISNLKSQLISRMDIQYNDNANRKLDDKMDIIAEIDESIDIKLLSELCTISSGKTPKDRSSILRQE